MKSRYIRRGLAGDKPFVDRQRLPSAGVDAHAGVHVLRDGFHCDVANILERLAAEHGRAAGENRTVPTIPSRLDYLIEEMSLLPVPAVLVIQTCLEVIEVVECVWRLHEAQFLIAEITDEARNEMRFGNMVRVQDNDELTVRFLKRMIEVTRLGVPIVRSNHVMDAQLIGQGFDGWPFAVVADVRLVRILHAQAGFESRA